MDSTAFARALAYLNYNRAAKWLSLVAAVGSALAFLVLLLLLGLFVDLLVNRGYVPSFEELSAAEKDAALIPLLLPEDADERKAGRDRVQADLDALDPTLRARALLPGWRDGGEPRQLPRQEQALLWYATLPRWVETSVSADAAEAVRNSLRESIKAVGVAEAVQNPLPDFGVLGLAVHTRGQVIGGPVRLLARWQEWTWAEGNRYYLGGLALIAFALAVARLGLLVASNFFASRAVIEAVTRLRRAVYHHTYRLGTLALDARGPSEAVAISTRHLEAVHEGLFLWLTHYFREPVKFVLLVAFAFAIHFWLALAFLLFALLVWIAGGQVAAYFRRRGRRVAARTAAQLGLVQESLTMMRLVKAYLMENFNQARVERQLRAYVRAQRVRYVGEAVYRPFFTFLGLAASLALLFVSGWAILNGDFGVTTAATLVTVLVCCYWPIVGYLDTRRALRRGHKSAQQVFDFLDRKADVRQDLKAEFLPGLSSAIEFDKVTLKEPGAERRLLKGVSLTVRAGQKVALVGADEREKHALVYLLSRFLDPSSGEVRIDGKNLRFVTLDSLRVQVAMVLQHDLVFNDTVANNIGCGDGAYPLPRIIEASKVAHAHQFIQKLPQGYETVIGAMGHRLTAGEKFRVALARAILREPAIYVIEEPAAPLDDDNKHMIDDTLTRILPGRTAIFLPHRLSTLRGCDRVYFLHDGEIKAAGEHRELLAGNELYRHVQYLEFNEFAGGPAAPTASAKEES